MTTIAGFEAKIYLRLRGIPFGAVDSVMFSRDDCTGFREDMTKNKNSNLYIVQFVVYTVTIITAVFGVWNDFTSFYNHKY